ncbi:CLUMA_CG014611, isoform A [Clunio marinus]|uniref:CLUMA_CG014611, isoform A n=1 Tax=Clunio marinus TaxID=568069 RepID=A0A1J1ILZ3_9DIPT|nr:CLUMA_CG014611, isoform A [Clunio marinus]
MHLNEMNLCTCGLHILQNPNIVCILNTCRKVAIKKSSYSYDDELFIAREAPCRQIFFCSLMHLWTMPLDENTGKL